MTITFSDELLAYKDKKKITALTVDAVKTSGTCCKVIVTKVEIGKPTNANKIYTTYEAYGVELFIEEKLKLSEKINFTYSKLLMREMIECQGYEIERSSAWF